MKPIIEVNHVWKEYQKGIDRRYKSLRDTLVGMPNRLFGTEKKKFWALEDIDFKVEAGESVGIIGRNGAGKSTLLKILSRITPPTKGEIILRGRVASLLEVGTGFHPELTGRENVFFNGSILGMKHAEIKRKFDEIVDFSGVESFIDTPLKHYSSGMQMRLAFSVAAHLDSEILLIDEVLAVGDAEFQKKCIGKMDDVSKGEGKTILFVSHDLESISLLTNNCIYIGRGKIEAIGSTSTIIKSYTENLNFKNEIFDKSKISHRPITIIDVRFLNISNGSPFDVQTGKDVRISIEVLNKSGKSINNVTIGLVFLNISGTVISAIRSDVNGQVFNLGQDSNQFDCLIPKFPLSAGIYSYNIILKKGTVEFDWIKNAGYFTVLNGQFYSSLNIPASNYQIVLIDQIWD